MTKSPTPPKKPASKMLSRLTAQAFRQAAGLSPARSTALSGSRPALVCIQTPVVFGQTHCHGAAGPLCCDKGFVGFRGAYVLIIE